MPTDDLDDDMLDEQANLPDDLDEEDLEDLEDDDEAMIDDEAIIDDELEPDDIEDDIEDDDLGDTDLVEDDAAAVVEAKPGREDEEEEDEEEDEDSDDVEASLDVILKERLVVADDDDDDDDEEVGDPDERGDSPLRVLPKQPGEFVCQSCFLVKHPVSSPTPPGCCAGTACDRADLAKPRPPGQDRSVTERYSPLDTLLDVFVYAPVGLALVATEEIPKLAAKGRAQLGGQLAMAKVVGQFAVAQGRRQLKPRPAAPSRRRGPAPAVPAGLAGGGL